jgi:HEAT repeat protein
MDQNQLDPETSETVPAELRQRFDELMRRRLYGRKSAQDLRRWGDIGIRLLVETVFSEDFEVRGWAIRVLKRLANPKDIPLLITLLAHKNRDAQWDVANILKGFGAKAVQPLLDSLPHAEPQQRQGILLALGRLEDTIATPYIIPELEHKDAGVRACAATALGDLRDIRAGPALAARLTDPDDDVRRRAVYALHAIGDPRAVPALITALHTDPDQDTRIWIIETLGELGDTRAVDPLLSHLFVPNIEEQASAAEALDNDLRAYVVKALGDIGDKRAVKPLLTLRDDTTLVDTGNPHTLRFVVIFALSQIGDRQALPTLLAALADPDADVRWAAALGLGTIGDASAIPALTAAQDDQEEVSWGGPLVSEAASEAIAEIQARQP